MRVTMNPIVFVSTDIKKAYEDDSFIGKLKDRLKISLEGESFIKELDLSIARIKLPPNFNQRAYAGNIAVTQRIMKKKSAIIAPKTFRILDFKLLNNFQKRLFAYGLINSIKLLLRVTNKSIKNSCIVIYDAADSINHNVVYELAKECKYCMLVSKDLRASGKLSDYVVANYGISPIVTSDLNYALSKADFIITSRELETSKPVWYIDNFYEPNSSSTVMVNDVSFAVPWEAKGIEFSYELLGAILGQMQEKDVEKALKYNGIYLDKIKFNQLTINNC
jgi:hypothetical protein